MVSTHHIIIKDPAPGVFYYGKFPEWVRRKYYNVIKGICQICRKPMKYEEMDIHRVQSGKEGGYYTLCRLKHPSQNCMFMHNKCHKLIESNKYPHVSHQY